MKRKENRKTKYLSKKFSENNFFLVFKVRPESNVVGCTYIKTGLISQLKKKFRQNGKLIKNHFKCYDMTSLIHVKQMRGILTKYVEFLNTWDVSLFCQSSLRFHEFFQSCFIFRVKIQVAASNSHAPLY